MFAVLTDLNLRMEGVRDCGPVPDPSFLSPPPDEDDQPVPGEPRQSDQAVDEREEQQHGFCGSRKLSPVAGYNLGSGPWVYILPKNQKVSPTAISKSKSFPTSIFSKCQSFPASGLPKSKSFPTSGQRSSKNVKVSPLVDSGLPKKGKFPH